ncbi:MAG: hypothetical protein VKP70_03470 [Cyanobacteriota bacterium]|nr:hypothetical protein [Cyanobacteriota bacterium]
MVISRTVNVEKNLVLHIGTEKTGTTSLQKLFAINRELLGEAGIYIPDFFGKFNHRLAEYAFEDDGRNDAFTKSLGVFKNLQAKQKLKAEIRDLWRARVSEVSAQTWIVSSEHFQSRLLSVEEVGNLWHFLSAIYDTITVVVYLRDPVQAAFSSLSTAIKCGRKKVAMGSPGDDFDNNCNHQKFLERWLAVVPRECMQVRLFDRQHFLDGDLYRDFFGTSRLDYLDGVELPARENESLSYPALRMLALVNSRIPNHVKNRQNELRGNITRHLSNYCSDYSSILPTMDKVDEFDHYYRQSNDYVRENFFPDLQGRLWSLPRTVDEGESAAMDGEFSRQEIEFAELLCRVWEDRQSLILKLKRSRKFKEEEA